MKKLSILTVMLGMVVLLAGCPQPQPTELRIVHTSPDLAPIDVCLDGNKFVTDLDYSESSVYKIAVPGTRTLRVVNVGAPCDSDEAVEMNINLSRSGDYTVVVGDFADDLQTVLFSDNNATPAAGKARIRLVHALPNAPAIDLRTDEGDMLFEDVGFLESGGYASIDAGAYNLRVRESVTGLLPIFNVNDVSFAANSVYTLYAIGTGNNPPYALFITADN